MDTAVEFRVLGPLEVVRGGREIPLSSGRQRTVLACLLVSAGRLVTVSTLIDRVWGQDPPSGARGTVQVHLMRLRRTLGDPALIETRPDGYLIARGPDDLGRLDDLTVRAGDAERAGDLDRALRALREATALWRGPILANVASSWLHTEQIPQLTERCLKTAEHRYELELRLGNHEAVIADLKALAAAHPQREPLHGLLMRALYRAGRQAEALDVYDRAAATLRDELGLDPGDRLQELRQAILTRTEDAGVRPQAPVSLVADDAWRAACQLPPAPADFTGRADALARIERLLAPERLRPLDLAVPIVTVSGPPGAGKTALAVHAAHRLRERFPDGQLYAPLGSRDPADVAEDLLRGLGLAAAAIPERIEARAAVLRARLADRRVLLVLDDADEAAQIQPLLPGTAGSAVLVTSRRLLADLPGNHVVRLGPLSPGEAGDLLQRMVGPGRVAADPDAARDIAAACGHLPLALRIAGARLAARPSIGLAGLAGRLRDHRRRLDELSLGSLEVRAGLRLAYQALDPAARTAFRRLGLLARADFSLWLLTLLTEHDGDGRDADRALEALVDANLLQPAGVNAAGEPSYRYHELTADFAAELAGSAEADGRLALRHLVRALTSLTATAEHTHARAFDDLPARRPADAPARPFADAAPVTVDAAPPDRRVGVSDHLEAHVRRLPHDPIGWFAAHRSLLVHIVEEGCARGLYEDVADLVDRVVPLLHRQVGAPALRRLREAVRDAARDAGDEPVMWRAEYGLVVLAMYTERRADIVHALRACVRAFERLGMTRELSYALGELVSAEVRPGAEVPARDGHQPLPGCSAMAERAVRLARQAGDRHAEVIGLVAQADALAASLHFDSALSTADRARRLAHALAAPHFEATALSRVTRCALAVGDTERAAEACRTALRLLDDVQDHRGTAWMLRESARIALDEGRCDDALVLAEKAAERFCELGDERGHALASATLDDIRRARSCPA
ncbi:BTAD domain-containing putative transcriptional regulator [Actinomadura sp. NPDC047616]|uniref:AfsR/SARP family transcriptional regulator n=1 Tax=Actinomadura sp. NPDC047616 TaxID=3155914 RepID=UPI003400B72A